MLKLKPYAHYLIIFGLAMLLVAIGQGGPSHIAWANDTNYQTVPTRTPTPNPDSGNEQDNDSGSQDNSSDQGAESNVSQIIGIVTDLSTGNPGASIIVRLNDIEVRTDTFGKYSLSGLGPGQFVVSLVLEGEAISAQEPVTVAVDGSNEVSVDLAYYSDPSQAQMPSTPTTAATNADAAGGGDLSQPDIAATSTATSAEVSDSSTATQATQTVSDTVATVSSASETEASVATANGNPPQRLPISGQSGYPGWLMFAIGLVTLIVGVKFSRDRRS